MLDGISPEALRDHTFGTMVDARYLQPQAILEVVRRIASGGDVVVCASQGLRPTHGDKPVEEFNSGEDAGVGASLGRIVIVGPCRPSARVG